MSGHLRGNWRGTKKSYMISYWPCEQKGRGKSYTCALSEGFAAQSAHGTDAKCRNASWCLGSCPKRSQNSGTTPSESPVDEYFVR